MLFFLYGIEKLPYALKSTVIFKLLKSVLKKGVEVKSVNKMSKAEALRALVKVTKIQKRFLNKLSK